MDNLETPYEDEASFIECTVCEKSIRGDTLYKIHLTTQGHLKKEDALVASGLAVRHHYIPAFKDILQYLDYMKLEEPIIGLNYLDELPGNEPQAGPRYTCTLCRHNANLPEMVHHVIGRKHRQKYVELKRPDLVTWNKQSIITHGGKIVRARAEIIERQDGRGTPNVGRVEINKLIPKRGIEGQLNISRVLPRQKQNMGRNISQPQRDVLPHPPDLKDYQDQYSHPGRYPSPLFRPEDPYMLNRGGPMYQQEDPLGQDCMEEEPQRADYSESDMYRQELMDPDYGDDEYEEEYVEEPQRRAVLEPGGDPRYDPREEMPHGEAQHREYYPEEAPSYRRPYEERDPLKEFYTAEVRRRGQVRSSEYPPSQPVFPEDDEQRWSLDRESGRHDTINRAGRQGSSDPVANRRSFPTPMENNRSRDGQMFHIIKDYRHQTREPHQEEAVANPGPSRIGPPASQRRVEATRAMSDIPEPFRRFLTGAANDRGQGKRKRKSRFSDATAAEVETTKGIFDDEYGPPHPKFAGRPRPVSEPLRHPDRYIESQSLHHTEGYQREGSESRGVFDMLKNVEIENAEEADFLKSKLCNLLKEFKTKKSEKAVEHNHGRAAYTDNNSFSPDLELSPRHQYDTTRREDSDHRRPEDLFFKDNNRGRGWQQHEHIPDKHLQEYHHPVRGEPRQSNRSRYEEVFGRHRMSPSPPDTHLDDPTRYPERFQEPMRPRDYPPADDGFLDSHSSAPPLHMQRGVRMDRGPRYSNNLDKITSTLLELVARK
ncbi:uncharacterized protein si:ch211-13c6.2 isoform X1 [Sebastes umbrosus]|uniref:uncharacterized protein si:ch211-13c6.2 isoform X1 n=2 Tax=Sebastes umbrosus TaxID=72105 RepID=UPI00189ED739|nr:uncharacterized protein si:ch211-13c6.2 isoform X1 [Sebastes umbrosus]